MSGWLRSILSGSLLLVGCAPSVNIEASAGAADRSTSAGSGSGSGGAPSASDALVVQSLDTGKIRLLISSHAVDCSLAQDFIDSSLYACDGFFVEALVPESAFVAGAVLEDGQAGVT